MSWVRIDDHFYDHPKWADAPGDSIALWLAAMAWCNRNNQFDGRIPVVKLAGLISIRNVKTTVADLVARHAFHADGTAFLIHEYAEYQQNDKVQRVRAARQAAGRAGAAARWGGPMANMANGMANESQTGSQNDGNENAPPPTTHLSLISDNPPTDVPGGVGDLPSRIERAADAYAKRAHAIAVGKGRKINDATTWMDSAKARVLKSADLIRLCREYPTAPADVISARLHGEPCTLHLHDRIPS